MSGTLNHTDLPRSGHATARTRVRRASMCLAVVIAVL